jgi:hypothetical protein
MFNPPSPFFAQAVAAAERAARQGMPITPETLQSEDPQLPISAAHELVSDRRFAKALEEVGVNFTPLEPLSTEQLAAVKLYLQAGGRTHGAKLRAIGVSQAKWSGWMRQQRFKALLAEGGLDRIFEALPGAQVALSEKAESGESWAVNLVFALTGFYDPNKVDDPRPIFEAIFEELSDSGVDEAILRRVAGKVRTMLSAGPPSEQAQPAMIMANPTQKAS